MQQILFKGKATLNAEVYQ